MALAGIAGPASADCGPNSMTTNGCNGAGGVNDGFPGVGLYYNSGQQGSCVTIFTLTTTGGCPKYGVCTDPANIPNLAGYTNGPNISGACYFFNPTTGAQAQPMKNDAASAWNFDWRNNYVAFIWYNSGYGGNSFSLNPGDSPYRLGNGLYNQDAAVSWWVP